MSTPVHDRRRVLLGAAAASWLVARGAAQAMNASWTAPEEDPTQAVISQDTWQKFTADGKPRAFAGNTVICPLPPQSKMRDALAALAAAFSRSTFARKLACLPTDSYHMTIFAGAADQVRTRSEWPADVGMDTPISECNRIIGQRIQAFRADLALPIRMRPDGERLLGSLRMVPVDEAEREKLRQLRNRLADEVYHFRNNDHDRYEFHISTAYQLARLTVEEEAEHQALLATHMASVMTAGPVVELGDPVYSTYASMFRFEPTLFLRTAAT